MKQPKGDLWGTLTFAGGAGTVTGANFLLEVGGKRILIDCGMQQGSPEEAAANWQDFSYDPKTIDALLVTHAHTDHIGRIPKLVGDGFRGKIYSTEPTKEISKVMFDDAVGLLMEDAKAAGRKPLYNMADIELAMSLWKGVPYHGHLELGNGVTATYFDAGHVLGSGLVQITWGGKSFLFSGDLGNTPTILLKETETFMSPDAMIVESVYGDRNHKGVETRTADLESIIEDTIRAGGTLMIPAFSLERTQELLFEINNLVEKNRIPQVPIYLDSPLAIDLTKIYKRSTEYFNDHIRSIIKSGDDIFQFPGLEITPTTNDSKAINQITPPKIIIAGSGMMNGGRILHHAERYLPDPKSTLLLVGYQAPGTLGRYLLDGAKSARIYGAEIPIRARIAEIAGYSGHKGSDGLVEFVSELVSHDKLKQVFVAMGEPRSSMFLAQRLRDEIGVNAIVPMAGETHQLYL